MDSSLIGMTVAIVILVMCSAYFSATETAFTSLNTIRMKTWAENGDKRAARALAVGEDYGVLGEGFERINIACSRKTLTEALRRIAAAVGGAK